VESAQPTVTVAATERKERQLVAGRYRLAAFHRADDQTEVWRALDETTHQVVTLEFLRDASMRERFLAQGRRMASIQQPSVMKVAAINEDPQETFVVYEHLVHVPVALDMLKPKDAPVAAPLVPAALPVQPAAAAPVSEPPALKPAAPIVSEPPALKPAAVVSEPPALRPTPVATVASPVAPPPVTPAPATFAAPAEEIAEAPTVSSERGLDELMNALRAREFGLIDAELVTESAWQIVDAFGESFKDFQPAEVVAIARDVVVAVVGLPLALAHVAGGARPSFRAPSLPRPKFGDGAPREPKAPKVPKVRAPRVEAVKVPKAPKAPRAPMPNPFARVRWFRVLTRGLVGGVIITTAVLMPPELEAKLLNLGGDLGSQVADKVSTVVPEVANQVANQVSTVVSQTISGTQANPPLTKPGFDVPPLTSYRATLESTGPAPKAKPNEMVEWVVALRNTGSAGWYRGLEGAQASLALADGTNAGVQTTAYVGPGQVGWFVVHFRAAPDPGTYTVAFRPRIDGLGQLADLGIHATVTVTAATP
jgi:hypothetical protein